MKKGIITLWINLFFAFLAVLLMIVFYFVFLRGSKEPQQFAIQESSESIAHNVLLQYLQSPVSIDGVTAPFADHIIMGWKSKKNPYQGGLAGQTKQFLAMAPVDLSSFTFHKIPERRVSKGNYALQVFSRSPGRLADEFLCIDSLEPDSLGGCRHPSRRDGYLVAESYETKATAYLPVSEQESLYVALLVGQS